MEVIRQQRVAILKIAPHEYVASCVAEEFLLSADILEVRLWVRTHSAEELIDAVDSRLFAHTDWRMR